MILVEAQEYHQAINDAHKVQYDTAEWLNIKNFYNFYLSTGYAPKGKQLIAKTELQQLRNNSREFEETARTNGYYIGRLLCNVTPKHQKKINKIGFEKFWKEFIKKDSKNEALCEIIFYSCIFSCLPIGVFMFAFLCECFGQDWGVAISTVICIIFIFAIFYIQFKIID